MNDPTINRTEAFKKAVTNMNDWARDVQDNGGLGAHDVFYKNLCSLMDCLTPDLREDFTKRAQATKQYSNLIDQRDTVPTDERKEKARVGLEESRLDPNSLEHGVEITESEIESMAEVIDVYDAVDDFKPDDPIEASLYMKFQLCWLLCGSPRLSAGPE